MASFRSGNAQSFAREVAAIPQPKALEEFDQPVWAELGITRGAVLKEFLFTSEPDRGKKALKQNLELLKACIEAGACRSGTRAKDASQVALLFLYDAFREDSSLFMQCEEILRQPDGRDCFQQLEQILTQPDPVAADKAAWLLTSIMTNCSNFYTKELVSQLLNKKIFSKECKCSALGKLEATCNLLKSADFRNIAWGCPDANKCVLSVTANDPPPVLYKYLFALWMLSYDKNIAATLQERDVVPVIKDIMATCRVEKVIRLGLVVIKSFLPDEKLALDIVETAILDVVQQLEFEKWRDQEIYENITEVSKLVAVQVSALSNFEKYEKEVDGRHLKWGYLHSNKFWGENINKFDQNGFGVIEKLCKLLDIDDEETQAVACHDIGEFAVLHPQGKRKLKELKEREGGDGIDVKKKVMELMESEKRDVKREALLCCQKIMLNKWQDASK